MLNKKREMSAEWAQEVLDAAPFVTMSLIREDGTAYGVPLSLARADEQTFYFHCAKEGEKMDALRRNPNVWLSAVSRCKPTVGPKDGNFTLEFRSAMAPALAEVVTTDEEKILGLRVICQRFLPDHMPAFDDAIARSLHRTAIVRLTLTAAPTGKRKEYDRNGDEMTWQRME